MAVRHTTKAFFNSKTEAERHLKKHYNHSDYKVRQHPKWRTWDVVRVSKTRRKRTSPVGFPMMRFG